MQQSAPQAASVLSAPGAGDNYAGRTKRPSDASKAPDFSIKDLDGNVISLSQEKGKVVILDFWATWCPPCRAEIPDFISLNTMFSKKDFVMLGAAVDDPTKVKNFITRMSMNYTVFIADQELQNDFGGIRGIPTTFVIDKEGYIVRQYVGYRPKATFEQDIKDLM
jgi:cytochrome c biogenesis protein CcmG/thiol:disulfide interchange protein DsbE